jgi:hypothetical protein
MISFKMIDDDSIAFAAAWVPFSVTHIYATEFAFRCLWKRVSDDIQLHCQTILRAGLFGEFKKRLGAKTWPSSPDSLPKLVPLDPTACQRLLHSSVVLIPCHVA